MPHRFPRCLMRLFWLAIREGSSVADASARAGVSVSVGHRWFRQSGGMPSLTLVPSLPGRHLSIEDREAIFAGLMAGHNYTEIGGSLGRATSTITRELDAHKLNPERPRAVPLGSRAGSRGPVPTRVNYSPAKAQAEFEASLRRPKVAKLAANPRLRQHVSDQLAEKHSPEQISQRLRTDFPDDETMRISHEAIYQALYVQSRGALKRELASCLRTGRAIRKPHRRPDQRRRRIKDMVSIADRPAEVADRAVPGHWEGDLILGKDNASAIGTLVERTTRFTLLLHLPGNHTAPTVRDAMISSLTRMPTIMAKTLTWDQGSEMAEHLAISAATGLDIYFCDPASPWQRGTNENTNGLLRQYFPKGTDLSGYHPDYLDYVAAQLNDRPRKTLNWQTPNEAFAELLSNPPDPSTVAMTG